MQNNQGFIKTVKTKEKQAMPEKKKGNAKRNNDKRAIIWN